LLRALVLCVGLRFLYQHVVVVPDNLYSLRALGAGL